LPSSQTLLFADYRDPWTVNRWSNDL